MLRFILRRRTWDGIEFRQTTTSTVDLHVPDLEKELTRGGYGGGPNNDSFDVTELSAVEVLKPVNDADGGQGPSTMLHSGDTVQPKRTDSGPRKE